MIRSLLLVVFVAVLFVAPVSAQSNTASLLVTQFVNTTHVSGSPVLRHAELTGTLPAPVYPARAIQFGVEGQVQVAFTVDEKGRARNVEIVEGIGADCDREVLRLIRKARFTPAMNASGKPVEARYTTSFIFTLNAR